MTLVDPLVLAEFIEDFDNDGVHWYGSYAGRGSVTGYAITMEDTDCLMKLGAFLNDNGFEALLDGFCQQDNLGHRTVCVWHHSLFDKVNT